MTTSTIQETKAELGKMTAKTVFFFFIALPVAIFIAAAAFVYL
jgi:hypothetical protein